MIGVSLSSFQFCGKHAYLFKLTDWYIFLKSKGIKIENSFDYFKNYKKVHELLEKFNFNAIRVNIEASAVLKRVPKKNKFYFEEKEIEELEKYENKKLVEKYLEILKDLKDKNFIIFNCANHFILPIEYLREGWLNKKIIPEMIQRILYVYFKFGEYFDKFFTLNEPNILAWYYALRLTPQRKLGMKNYFKVLFNMLLTHVYVKENIKEKIGIILHFAFTNSKLFDFLNNKLPLEVFKGKIQVAYKKIPRYILPFLENLNLFKNKLDFLGVNYYYRLPLKFNFIKGNVGEKMDNGFEPFPKGIYLLTKNLDIEFYITENGVCTKNEKFACKVIEETIKWYKKTKSKGYFYWTITDNFIEWFKGLDPKYNSFGLFTEDLKPKERLFTLINTLMI